MNNEAFVRDEKIRAIHQVMHPGVEWDFCDKFWCKRFIPAFVDDKLIDPDGINYEAAQDAWLDHQHSDTIIDIAIGV